MIDLLQNIPLPREWVYTLVLPPVLLAARSMLLRLYLRRHADWEIEAKRRVLVFSRNVTLFLILLTLFLIWASQIQTFALSMVALAAATVVATKELIMCLSGSLIRITTKQYSVGDYIEIHHFRGRIIDINLFNTLMMEIGPNPLLGQLSGKTLSFPNSLLLSHGVHRDNIFGQYVVHTFDIPVPITLDSDEIVPNLMNVLNQHCEPYTEQIADYLEALQVQQLFITPAARARISRVPFDDKVYRLVIRFASPVNKRLETQQAVLDEFIRVQYRLLNRANLS